MTEYVCLECGKVVEIDLETAKKIQCPFCGYRILTKQRRAFVRRVSSD
jgi:DNA-directed RNA polymerase subunit RPC12/RpoP